MAIFLDACFFITLYNESDIHHKRAAELSMELDDGKYCHLITSDDIFDEAVSVTFNSAFKLFCSSKEPFSFTDCTTQAVMEIAQIQHIATFDKIFDTLDVEVIK